jgi:hypothetical protein
MTGAHTMQELTCSSCSTYVGWKIVRAHDKSESWKDGNFLLELEHLYFKPESLDPLDDTSNRWQLSLSGSDSEPSPWWSILVEILLYLHLPLSAFFCFVSFHFPHAVSSPNVSFFDQYFLLLTIPWYSYFDTLLSFFTNIKIQTISWNLTLNHLLKIGLDRCIYPEINHEEDQSVKWAKRSTVCTHIQTCSPNLLILSDLTRLIVGQEYCPGLDQARPVGVSHPEGSSYAADHGDSHMGSLFRSLHCSMALRETREQNLLKYMWALGMATLGYVSENLRNQNCLTCLNHHWEYLTISYSPDEQVFFMKVLCSTFITGRKPFRPRHQAIQGVEGWVIQKGVNWNV